MTPHLLFTPLKFIPVLCVPSSDIWVVVFPQIWDLVHWAGVSESPPPSPGRSGEQLHHWLFCASERRGRAEAQRFRYQDINQQRSHRGAPLLSVLTVWILSAECKVWRNPLNLFRGAEYNRLVLQLSLKRHKRGSPLTRFYKPAGFI